MQLRKHLWTMCSVLLMAALLAACAAPAAAPTATPVPPTATPVPPTATPGPLDVARAYETAWNTFDAAAVTALFAEPFNTDYGFPMTDKTAWSEGWPYGMARGMGMRIAMHDCEVSGDTVTCKVASQSPCFTMDVIEALTVQDGKITKLEHRGIPAEDARWEEYSTAVEKWAEEQGLDEWPAYQAEVAKGTYGYDWGAGFVSLCQKYADFLEKQVPVITASAQALVDALNGGDVDAAVAYFTDDAKVTFAKDQVAGKDQLSSLFNWLAGKETQVQITDCVWQGDKLVCTMSVVDGCMAASGAPEGLPDGMITFLPQEEGALRNVVGVLSVTERKPYETWLEAEAAWASANRADEFAQAQGYSREAGAMAVKLCREYAETLK